MILYDIGFFINRSVAVYIFWWGMRVTIGGKNVRPKPYDCAGKEQSKQFAYSKIKIFT